MILYEDAFGYGFIGRTGLYFSPKRQACGLLALSLALSHGERESGCQTRTFSGFTFHLIPNPSPSDFQQPDP
ncbi:hypothetical protein AAC610_05595, partial [Neisseria gonorrhoeae]